MIPRVLKISFLTFVIFEAIVVVLLFLFCAYVLPQHVNKIPVRTNLLIAQNEELTLVKAVLPRLKVKRAAPAVLKISRLGIVAPIERVGLTAVGAMDTPKKLMNVGWLTSSVLPGNIGSAVIAGHYNGVGGEIGIFNTLHEIRKGDTLTLERTDGTVTTFLVREIRSYAFDAKVTEVFESTDGRAHLNLITCGGVWNNKTKLYSKRLVVFTDKQ